MPHPGLIVLHSESADGCNARRVHPRLALTSQMTIEFDLLPLAGPERIRTGPEILKQFWHLLNGISPVAAKMRHTERGEKLAARRSIASRPSFHSRPRNTRASPMSRPASGAQNWRSASLVIGRWTKSTRRGVLATTALTIRTTRVRSRTGVRGHLGQVPRQR
jgi:hypothetical protein